MKMELFSNNPKPVEKKVRSPFTNGLKVVLGGAIFSLCVSTSGCIAGATVSKDIELQHSTTQPATSTSPAT